MQAYRLLTTVFMVILISIAIVTAVSLAVGINALSAIYGNLLVIVYVLMPYIMWLLIQINSYDIISKSSGNATAIAVDARSITARTALFTNYVRNLQTGNDTIGLPARFTDPEFGLTFQQLYDQMAVVTAAAGNITAEVSVNNATSATAPIQDVVDIILGQTGFASLLGPLYRETSMVTLDSFYTARVQQYAFAAVVIVVLVIAAVIVLWPLRQHLRYAAVHDALAPFRWCD